MIRKTSKLHSFVLEIVEGQTSPRRRTNPNRKKHPNRTWYDDEQTEASELNHQ
jgi:hypothetical protein